jgi:predicted solute-binding protein
VMKCAKDGACNGYSDEEVFGWAVHYYDEDDIKNIKPVSGKAIVNHSVELTEDDKKEAKAEAMKEAIAEAKEEAKKSLSGTIELSEEDLKEAKKQAIEKIAIDQKQKLVAKAVKNKTETKVEQVDLFA